MIGKILRVLATIALALVILAALVIFMSKSNGGGAVTVLQANGYDNIATTSPLGLGGCGENQMAIARWTAQKNGIAYHGIVCQTNGLQNDGLTIQVLP
jgi:hypothetical protein